MKTKTIEAKSWKKGTYAFTKYYVDGRLFHEISVLKRECGVGWFASLPTNEKEAQKEDITGNTPSWLDSMPEAGA